VAGLSERLHAPIALDVTSRALALLASLASPMFMIAAIAAWVFELWPANPTTLAISAVAVVGGPVLGMVHVHTADEHVPAAAAPATTVGVAAPVPLTQRAAAARAFHNWRETVHPAIERRDRERRANRWLRT
jgi:hypothetical protein